MKTVCAVFLLSAFFWIDLPAQGVVRPKDQREAILERGARLLAQPMQTPESSTVADQTNPFSPWREVEPVADESAEPLVERQARRVRLPDAEVLDLVVERFRPSGSMIGAGTAFLNLPGGNRLELGQVFPVTIRGETYEVTVERITTRGYTLRVGEATVTRNFLQDRLGAGTILRPGERSQPRGDQ